MAGKSKKSGSKAILIAFEIVIIIALLFAIIYLVFLRKSNSTSTETTQSGYYYVNNEDTTPEDLGISDEVQKAAEEGGTMVEYLNIALFGIDATSTGIKSLEKGYRSDSIIIASIKLDTKEVKLCSVYRDTYLNTIVGGYQKCNAAYALGGGNSAISMLNSNLDLDISNWVSISYKGLADAIDSLGGVYIEVDSSEIDHLNNYQIAISEVLGTDYVPVTQTGYQLLDGIQASAYCRIRYTAGDDYKRAERQREVIQAIINQAKKADASTLVSTFNKVSSNVLTSIDSDTFLELVKNISQYSIVDETGFPNESLRTTANVGAKGSCIIPLNLESNVKWLHEFLFDDSDYQPSSTVTEISEKIYSDTNAYIGN